MEPSPENPTEATTGTVRRIAAQDLRKTYGGRRVVDGVHVSVSQGEIV